MLQETAKLGDFLNPIQKEKINRTSQKTEPIYIKKLVEVTGNQTAAAALMGLSPSAISAILSDGETVIPNELAARFIWERDYMPKLNVPEMGLAIITAEKYKLDTLKDLVFGLGGTFQYIDAGKGK